MSMKEFDGVKTAGQLNAAGSPGASDLTEQMQRWRLILGQESQ